jgi:protein-tyrosine phosphatase
VGTSPKLKVLFVCLGNICRSPLAEGVFRHMVNEAGLADSFEIDSAGTSNYHIGDAPDARTTRVAKARGVALTGAARQIKAPDLDRFDYVIAMDRQNLANVRELTQGAVKAKIHLLREFEAGDDVDPDVPDPYYGGPRGFEDVHDIVERACAGLLAHIRKAHNL